MHWKKFVTLTAISILGFGTISPATQGLVSNAYATQTTTTNDKKLADGHYQLTAKILKAGTSTSSVAHSYFDETADLVVKQGKMTLTLHMIKDKSLLTNLKTSSDQKALNVISTGDNTEDIELPITALDQPVNIAMDINIPHLGVMHQTADIQTDSSTLKTIALDESSSSTSSASSSSAKQDTSSETQASKATSTSKTTTSSSSSSVKETPANNNPETITTPTTGNLLFDPSHLIDGSYEVPITILKQGLDTTSLSNAFFNPKATVNVSANGTKETVTLHLVSYGNMIKKFDLAGQPAQFSNVTAKTADLTFNVTDQFKNNRVPAEMTIALGAGMNQAADVSFGTPLYAEPAKTTDDTKSDSSSSVKQSSSSATSTKSSSDDTSTTKTTSTSSVSNSSSAKNDSSKTSSASSSSNKPSTSDTKVSSIASSKSNSTKVSSSSSSETNATSQKPSTDSSTSTKPATGNLLFDPNHLVDGTYEVPFSVLKHGLNTPSLSNAFFNPKATVKVSNNGTKETVTLHLTSYGNMIKQFDLAGQPAQFSNVTAKTADLTFNVTDQFKTNRVPAEMTIALGAGMNQTADVSFNTPLYAEPAQTTKPSDATSASSSSVKQSSSSSVKPSSSSSTPTKQPNKAENFATIFQQDANGNLSKTPSAAQNFLDKAIKIKDLSDGNVQVTFHTSNGAEFIKSMTIGGVKGSLQNQAGQSADIVFKLPKGMLNHAVLTDFSLVTPVGAMDQKAYVSFNDKTEIYNGTPTKTAPVIKASSTDLIDPTKNVQYIPYTVWNDSRSALSTANNYYTHSAKVVKVGNGYNVYLTVQETAGYVNFTPLSVNYSNVFDQSHQQTNGNDVWTYAFHVNSKSGLNNPLPAKIQMHVTIAGINQTFSIWLAFGQAQNGGMDYMNNGSAAGGLPASSIALTGSPLASALSAAGLPTTAKAAQSTQDAPTSSSAKSKLPNINSYPFLAEIAGFLILSSGIIGFAFYKKYRN
ncbi:NEAT domain-containing protein [Paucilactobacillus sp. N302-9]